MGEGILEHRSGDRRNICAEHQEQHENITIIANSLARQDGQWKILMWGIGLVAIAVLTIGLAQHNTVKATQKLVISLDKTFTVYMITSMEEAKRGFTLITDNSDMIEINRELIRMHEERIKSLEKPLSK